MPKRVKTGLGRTLAVLLAVFVVSTASLPVYAASDRESACCCCASCCAEEQPDTAPAVSDSHKGCSCQSAPPAAPPGVVAIALGDSGNSLRPLIGLPVATQAFPLSAQAVRAVECWRIGEQTLQTPVARHSRINC